MAHRLDAYYRREHANDLQVLATPEDVDRLIDDLIDGPRDHNLAQLHCLDRPLLPSGYPDHELMVGVNRDLQLGLLAFMDGDVGNIFTAGALGDDAEPDYYLAGHRMEYPTNVEIPLVLVREAVKEFLQSGGSIPACVEWKTVDSW
jgi:hypothetical protein